MKSLHDKIELFRHAIVELKQVEGVYHGYPRVCCPHLLGTKKHVVWRVLVWQFDGSSSNPASLPTWRGFDLADFSDLSLRDGEWHRGWVTGRREQRLIDEIDTAVDQAHAAEVRQI